MPYPHPLVRLTAFAATLLVAAGCTQAQPTPKKDRTSTHAVTIVPTPKTSRFDVIPKQQSDRYTVTLAWGAPIDPGKNFVAGGSTGLRLGSACKLKRGDKVVPFTLYALWNKRTPAQEATLLLHSYELAPSSKRELTLPSKAVQIELAHPGGTPHCDDDPSVAATPVHYQVTVGVGSATALNGWIILRGRGLGQRTHLAFTSPEPYSSHGATTVTNTRGFAPYPPNGSGRRTGGSLMFKVTFDV